MAFNRFNNDIAEDVLKHADIVRVVGTYLNLTKQGKNYKAICPFHDDTSPSLTISPEKQMFKCFACGTGGKAIYFVQKIEHISYNEAIKKVADISDYHPQGIEQFAKPKQVDEKKEELIKCLHDLNLYYQFALNTPDGKEGIDYFDSRNLDSSIRSKYKLGFAPKDGKATIDFLKKKGYSVKTIEDTGIAKMLSVGNYRDMNEGRVTFPICDIDGNVIGFSARRLKDDDTAKYMNTPETYLFHKTNNLYNIHIAKDAAKLKGFIYVCEGFMDVYALGKIGIDAAVATMGTALTSEHIQILKGLNVEIRLCLDGDLPGQKAMMKIARDLNRAGVSFRVVDNQGSSKDPDEILNQDGEEALKEYLNRLVGHTDFALNYYLRSNPLKTSEEKKMLLKEFLPILLRINSQIELDSYLRKLEKITGFDVESIRELVKKAKANDYNVSNPASYREVFQNFHPEREALQKLVTAERELLYQMGQNKAAVSFYEQKIGGFYDDIYRQIANFMVEYAETHDDMDINGVIVLVESSDLENRDELLNDLTSLLIETHPNKCDEKLLNNLLDTIDGEKKRITDEDILESSLEGKSELEKARIISEFRKRKMAKR
ncbi:MAG: DNA primase [Bacilli bacterium]|nr:DNA primase [Bacilli bacterium]